MYTKLFLLCAHRKNILLSRNIKIKVSLALDEFFNLRFDLIGGLNHEKALYKALLYGNLAVVTVLMKAPKKIYMMNCLERFNPNSKAIIKHILSSISAFVIRSYERTKKKIKGYFIKGYYFACFLNLPEMMIFFAKRIKKTGELPVVFLETALFNCLDHKEALMTHKSLFGDQKITKAIGFKINNIFALQNYIDVYGFDPLIMKFACYAENIECIDFILINHPRIEILNFGLAGACIGQKAILVQMLIGLGANNIGQCLRITAHIGSLGIFKILLQNDTKKKLDLYYVISSMGNDEIKNYILSIHTPDLTIAKKLVIKTGVELYINRVNELI